ncbi:MFS transporter [Phaeocystidibacter marisrubri]|uniref:MFS transporter n=1 Tax=Phaeocystidibacter marisrubri TaxID=1577780 RepID=A0A6L3ZIA0_9FLAO|nr:MFS transporter [Phaeocystidibacter marisrubri]KAB2817205.1 MFS transporter [Phaeocystidibacter marisrubri]GGH76430.1 MFS transporter [Phaeocystidibacter marisrubri]
MKSEKKSIQRAWAFYDWANSSYSLIISTAIFPIYYSAITESHNNGQLEIFGSSYNSSAVYSATIAASFLLIATLSPYLSALADVSGRKKAFMRGFVFLGSISCMSIFFFTVDHIWIGLVAAFLASIGFSGSLVFYNAFLPEIAEPEEQDGLSARGFMLGYIGSSLLLIVLLVIIQYPEWLGTTKAYATRWSFVAVGLWWLLWSFYPLRKLPYNPYHKQANEGFIGDAYKALKSAFLTLIRLPRLGRFVMAFFFFSCGVQTTIFLATLFGTEVLDMKSGDLILTVLIIQFVAILGAWLFAKLSALIGNIKAIAVAVLVWVLVCLAAYFITTTNQFLVLGGAVGLVMGGIQALARSTYSKMLPETEDHATFFSFYDVAEKVSTTLGMGTIAYLSETTGDLRNAAIALTAFFVISLIFLFFIPKSKYVY